MSIVWLLTNAVAALFLPPLSLLIPAAAGMLMRRRFPRGGPALTLCALALLTALSTGVCARLLMWPLEEMNPPWSGSQQGEVIVILGGGRSRNAPEYAGHDVPIAASLARLRYGARLQRQTGLPILVTGGSPEGAFESEAQLMARALREDFSVPVRWVEANSDNTAENARYSAEVLRSSGVRSILLVTDAMHMPRARAVFLQTGLQVVPAPTNYRSRGPLLISDFIPNAAALRDSSYALHEWIGALWYALAHHGQGMKGGIRAD
ncbi:YdcF family protein [Noviherbaspirillum pedocola]|uniref:YdcF family protein n=1 Tax=Noviherbaspirillum pedocola TaxID=2801341 RepID=A0A934SUX4_9BURK|nr:YdcF family protein [Noviherbaspirillum pedocola]MBK4737040.1 YdcF family protein [Noviherbaspirillum pedocola]